MADEPQEKYAMAFIDGQNLFQHAKAAFGHFHPNFDPIKLHKAVCAEKGWIPNLVRFYTGIPDKRESSMWAGYWEKRLLWMKRAGIHVVTRPLRYRKQEIEHPDGTKEIFSTAQEKGIDVRLALDIVGCARKGEYNVGIIYSQDQDLTEVVEEVKDIAREHNRWIRLACAFPYGPNASSKRGVNGTDWIKMDEAFYNACLDPRDYRPARPQLSFPK